MSDTPRVDLETDLAPVVHAGPSPARTAAAIAFADADLKAGLLCRATMAAREEVKTAQEELDRVCLCKEGGDYDNYREYLQAFRAAKLRHEQVDAQWTVATRKYNAARDEYWSIIAEESADQSQAPGEQPKGDKGV